MSFELILPFLRPIEALLLDENVSEIMGNPDASWWYERDGIMFQEQNISFDAGKLQTGLEVIANQLGKKLDEDNPLLHAQLPDGSRLAAVIPPVVRCTPALIIRKFTSRHYTVDDLIARGTLTRALADFLAEQIRSGKTLPKGAHIQVEGELRSREYASKKTDTKRRVWEIRVASILKLDRAEKAAPEDQDHDEVPQEETAA